MRFEELGDLSSVPAVPLHTLRQRHQAAADEPGVERAERAAQVHQHLLADALDPRLRPQHRAAQRVAVPVEILGQAVDDVVRAQRQRPLQRRPGPGRVHGQQRARGVRDPGQRGDVREAQDRVRRRLGVDDPRVGAQRGLHLIEVARVHQADLDAEAREVQPEQLHRARVAHLAGDEVVATAEEGERQRRDRGHAGRHGQAGLRAFERGQPVFERAHRGIAPPRVGVRRPRRVHRQRVEQLDPEAGQPEAGGHVQRRPQRAGLRIRLFARMDGQGVEVGHGHLFTEGDEWRMTNDE